MKKIFIYLIAFFLIGEAMIRFDQYFKVMEDKRVVKISTDIKLTPEYKLFQEDFFRDNNEDFKVMVIGDSYIHGGGIEFKDNFSQNLKQILSIEKGNFNNAWVLDVSKPDSNNLDNNEAYFQFVNDYHPDVVIIGYNINDIEGNLIKRKEKSSISDFKDKKASGEEEKSLIGKVYKFIYKSEFIHFAFQKTHNQLKSLGVVIPGSRFDGTLKSYSSDKENWMQSKKLLKDVIDHTIENNIQLIVYKFPEINLIEHPNIFAQSDEAISAFFEKYPSVNYIDGTNQFRDKESKDYMLSKYDGHPNEKAHKEMAKDVFRLIKKTNTRYNKNN